MTEKQTHREALEQTVLQRISARRLLIEKALLAFSKNPDLINQFIGGQSPKWPELAPLTEPEKAILFGIIAKATSGEPNVD